MTTSPRLGIRFVVGNHELVIYRPDGRQFLSSVELAQRAEQAEQQLQDMQVLLQQYRDTYGGKLRFGDLE
jgi:hypothetical protein